MEQSLTLFQKRDDLDELEGFQQQELAKVKHMVCTCSCTIVKKFKLKEKPSRLKRHTSFV